MERTCTACSVNFEITDEDLAFYDKVSPIFNGKKERIPPPTHCPNCRLRRRMSTRNQAYMYQRKSSKTGKTIFSGYPESVPFPIIEKETWFSDAHDGREFGRDPDFSRPFFEQFMEIRNVVPLFAASVLDMENSEYCNNASHMKNCYLVFNTSYSEDSMYGENVWFTKDTVDCTQCLKCEVCYDCTKCESCYGVQNAIFSENCSDSYYLSHCRSCKNCFCCVNLSHKEYCWFNEQLTKEEYESRLKQVPLSSYSARQHIAEQFHAFTLQFPRPHAVIRACEDCTGHCLSQCKSVQESFHVSDAQNVKYGFMIFESTKDCMDFTIYGTQTELIYESIICGDRAYNIQFSNECWNGSSNLLYCQHCVSCDSCFGCNAMHNKKYCILNKQYTKEEYEALVPKIIEHMRSTGEWGEFFPEQETPFGYNHTLSQRYFPKTKEEILAAGFRWQDDPPQDSIGACDVNTLPDGLPESDDLIIVRSEFSGRAFKITSREIKRYRELNVPLPRMAYDERMDQRSELTGGVKLYDRTCAKSGKPIQTIYPPDSPWIIWDREEWEKEFSA